MMGRRAQGIPVLVSLALLFGACSGASGAAERLQIVATTSIVADVVRAVAGEEVETHTLLPAGADPHAFDPSPGDVSTLIRADLVFINGLGLEVFLDDLLQTAGGDIRVVSVSKGLEPLAIEGEHAHENAAREAAPSEPEEAGSEHQEEGAEHAHDELDPHVWFDPLHVIVWAHTIATALSELDPGNAALYQSNAAAYEERLRELDAWIREQVETVPPERRMLVTDHEVFGYFAARYGFEVVGTIIPGLSTQASPSAQDLAQLETKMRDLGVRAVFVDAAMDAGIAERVAQDTGVRLVPLYTESLTGPGGPAASYLDFMRYNVSSIVEALRDGG